jgi:hypothetical protein
LLHACAFIAGPGVRQGVAPGIVALPHDNTCAVMASRTLNKSPPPRQESCGGVRLAVKLQ